MSSSESEDWECPLCMEEMDIDDRGFFPCECGYQICRFCHNRISEDYGGRCPACRRLYAEQTPRWKPISPAQVAKIKNEKKAKEREKREIESNNRRHLANVRVVQKNLVYVIGLPTSLSTEEHLRSQDYFGQFGRINKIVINRRQTGSNSHHPTVGVYVTYATKEDATKAINAVDGSILEGRVLRATFGTTKYCSYYLRSIPCQNPGCMYLHEPGEEADSFTKEDLAANRAGLREGHEDEFDQEEELHQPISLVANHSPNAHLSTGRVQAVPAGSFPGFQNNRIQATTQPSSSAVSSTAAPPLSHAATATSRVRKASEINGLRPRSVEPHSADNEAHTGSALPATASWASRAMAKKPSAESAADAKTRKSESSGGTMTLRMIPASRGKSASFVSTSKPTPTSAPPLLASTSSVSASSLVSPVSGPSAGRDRLKSSAAASELLASASSAAPPVSQQQQAREKKQQTRNQTRAQQKAAAAAAAAAAELTDAETTSEEKPESAAKQPTKGSSSGATTRKAAVANKEATNEKRAASSTSEPKSKSAQKASEAAVVVATTSEAMAEQLEAEAEVASLAVAAGGASRIEAAASQQSDNIDKRGLANGSAEQGESAQEDVVSVAQDDNNDATTSDSLNALDNDSSQLSHTSSALSFQTITDSLFAQLNAKVSTPTGTTLPAFANVSSSAYDVSYPGARIAAGFPISGTDPLLFPPSVGAESASSAAYGRMGGSGGPLDAATSPFNLFASSQYSQSPLSALLTDPASLVGGSSRDTPISANIGTSSRQRSRWDFVQADEASAQAELQSVLGRGGSNSNIGHPQAQALGMPAFTSSRDLGMFSTPIQGDYMGGPWGGQHADSATANTAPFPPPPGFGGRKLTESSFQAESRARSPLVPGATPVSNGIIGGSTASNTLLSRLIGSAAPDSSGMSGSGNEDSASPSTLLGGYLSQQQQSQSQQDPAILSSYMAAAVAAAGPQQQQQQQQQYGQVGRARTDPNVLNSLLARLHLGQGDGSLQLSSMGTPQGSALSHQAFGSRVGPALGAGYQQQQHQQYQQHQNHNHQQGGSILPPGLMPMGAPGLATSPVYGGGQFGGGSGMGIGMNMNMGMSMGMGMGASESHMINAGNNGSVGNRSQQHHQLHHMQQLQQLQQLQQQQQQSLMMQRMSQAPILNAGHQPSSSNSGNGFVDPAIMNFGRMNALNNPPSMSSAMPGSPVGPPPGIASPPSGELSVAAQQQMHSMMLSRSANSSGRSRFLNHFSAETAGAKGAAANSEQEADGGGQLARDADSEEPAASNGPGMANGVPPGLPTTGLFGELLRRSKHELVTDVGTTESPMPYPVSEADRSSKFVSGRMMLSDIEHRLDVARREARELQAQLSTVIGQNQSVMWALANNGNAGSNTSAGDAAPSHHAPHPSHGVSYTAGNM